MYCNHFGLNWRPFDARGESDFFIADPRISKDLVRLGAALTSRGSIVAVTGVPGVGKTAIIDAALRPMPAKFIIARPDVRYADAEELFTLVLADFGMSAASQDAACLRELREFARQAHESGRQPLVCLDAPVFNTAMAKKVLRLAMAGGEAEYPLNIALQGPDRLHPLLNVAGLIHLRQRLLFRYRVQVLTAEQSRAYIGHRLQLAGGDAGQILQEGVCEKIHAYAGGVPRLINTLTDAALTETFVSEDSSMTLPVLERVARALGWQAPKTTATNRPVSVVDRAATPAGKDSARVSSIQQNLKTNDSSVPGPAVSARHPAAPVPVNSTVMSAARIATAVQPDTALRLDEDRSPSKEPAVPKNDAAVEAAADANDMSDSPTGMAGKLRLEDLDDRLAETFFTEDPDMIAKFRKMAGEKSADDNEPGR